MLKNSKRGPAGRALSAPSYETHRRRAEHGLGSFDGGSSKAAGREKAIRFLVNELDGLVTLVSAVIIGVSNFFGAVQPLREPAVAALAVAVAFRIFRLKYQLADVLTSLTKRADAVEESVASFHDLLRSERLHEAEVCDRRGFYRHMIEALKGSTRSVDLAQFDEWPPKHFGIAEMLEYFDLQPRIVRKRPHVIFRRIVTISTFEKLEWLVDILDRVKDCANFQINFIDITQNGLLPPPLSLQIFDREQLCIVDPAVGYNLSKEQRSMLWIQGRAACEVFSLYYDSMWNLGRRIKEGSIIYWDVLEGIVNDLSVKYPEKQKMSIAALERIRLLSAESPTS